MKNRLFLGWLLVVTLTVAACKSGDEPEAEEALAGTWSGDTQITKAGDCEMKDSGPFKTDATWQVSGTQVVGRLSTTTGTTTLTVQLNGTIDGNTVRLAQTNMASCNGGAPREYESKFEGIINGKNLTLATKDTICPAMNCIFIKTIRLTKQ